jgi:hypothetical protein
MTGWERLGIGGLSHLPQATTGPAVTAAGAHQASHDEG